MLTMKNNLFSLKIYSSMKKQKLSKVYLFDTICMEIDHLFRQKRIINSEHFQKKQDDFERHFLRNLSRDGFVCRIQTTSKSYGLTSSSSFDDFLNHIEWRALYILPYLTFVLCTSL
jgi:CTP:phosphocholine cytidylyltransferase-like protein